MSHQDAYVKEDRLNANCLNEAFLWLVGVHRCSSSCFAEVVAREHGHHWTTIGVSGYGPWLISTSRRPDPLLSSWMSSSPAYILQNFPVLADLADPTGLQVLKKCRVSGRRHFCHPTSFQGRGCENGRSTEDPASGS